MVRIDIGLTHLQGVKAYVRCFWMRLFDVQTVFRLFFKLKFCVELGKKPLLCSESLYLPPWRKHTVCLLPHLHFEHLNDGYTMKHFQRLFSVFALCFFSLALNAQDIHFSQFYLSPLNLNPAMTGVMNCSKRLSVNYRNQYASIMRDKAYNTFSAAYDARIPVSRYDNFGIGVTMWGDRAGSLDFSTMQARLSLSYAKRMGGSRTKANYLVVGADAGVTQRGYDASKGQFGSQNNNGTWDPILPTNETGLTKDYIVYPDISAGLLWFSVLDKYQNWYAGAAYSHINRANQSFTDAAQELLHSKFTLHAGGEFLVNPRFGLVPGMVVFLQNPQLEVNAGTSLKFMLGNSRVTQQALQFGMWTRLSHKLETGNHFDAIIFSTRFDYNQFNLGFSYDLNVSSAIAATNGNGAFEFSMIYKICGAEKRRVYCPNF